VIGHCLNTAIEPNENDLASRNTQKCASEPFTSQPNQLDKGSVITVLMKYLDLRIAPIDDVKLDVSY
jgi:hypothetical protein